MNVPVLLVFPHSGKSWREQSEKVLLTAMVCGEARGEGLDGMCAVAYVAINRLHDLRARWGTRLYDVLLRPKQFSCFNEGDPNADEMRDPLAHGVSRATWARCQWVAEGVLSGMLPDNTKGATHYLTAGAAERVTWDDKMQVTGILAGHIFLKEVA